MQKALRSNADDKEIVASDDDDEFSAMRQVRDGIVISDVPS